jgi:hypothetical protein
VQRSLEDIIECLEAASRELQFHGDRLSRRPPRAGEAEGEHIEDIGKLYRESARGCAVLARYQRGRLRAGTAPAPDGNTGPVVSDV